MRRGWSTRESADGSGIQWLETAGHSIAAGGGGTLDPESGYTERLRALLGIPRARRLAVGGAIACWPTVANTGDGGYPQVLQEVKRPGSAGSPAAAAPYVPRSQLALLHYGLNDLAILGSQKPLPFQTAMRTMLSRFCAAAIFEDEDAKWARVGTWTPLGQTVANSGAQVYFTTTANDKATLTLPADFPGGLVVAIGLWCNATWGQVTYGIKVNGQARADLVFTPTQLTDQGSAAKHIVHTLRLGKGVAGDAQLPAGAVTIEIQLKAGPGLAIDSGQIEADPLDGPLLVCPLPHKPQSYALWNTWAHGPGAGQDPMNNAAVDAWKVALQAVLAEFPARTIGVELDGLGLNTAALVVADGAHPNDRGHGLVAVKLRDAIVASGLVTDRILQAPVVQPRAYYRVFGAMGNAALAANWSQLGGNSSPLGVRKSENGKTRIRGAVKAAAGAGTQIGTIPVGFRPSGDRWIPVTTYSGSAYAAGQVFINAATGAFSLVAPAVSTAAGNFVSFDHEYDGEQ